MAGGALLQLVAYGAQDIYLTANPQITFFKQLYRRHSNFAMESIEQTFNGVANFGKRVTCTIARNGDLITRVYLQVTLPAVSWSDLSANGGLAGAFAWIPFVGQYLINSVELEIGGQRIDKHYGHWLHVWNELTLPTGKARDYLSMVNGYGGVGITGGTACNACDVESTAATKCLQTQAVANLASLGVDAVVCGIASEETELAKPYLVDPIPAGGEVLGCLPEHTLYIPLEFWFNRHTGLALPLIALQYHEVKINLEINDVRNLVNTNVASASIVSTLNTRGLVAASLYVDYIYLDTEERRRFAQVAHEYLIEQLQYTGEESVTSSSNKIQMSFNHPCKELVFTVQNPSYIDCYSQNNQPWNYADTNGGNPVVVAKIQLNGHDRFTERGGEYFNRVQPYQHHTASPSTGINVYSFALKPEELQPSGTCNFSRIDNAVLQLTLTPSAVGGTTGPSSANVRIYATNYNVLRIMSGMGGLAYSN
jgi:hypothetical protein